jgi:VanZ family protein
LARLTRQHLDLAGCLAALLVGVAIAVATLGPPAGPIIPGSDKLAHLVAFAALAFPLSFAWPRRMLPVVLGVLCYGGLIELVQPFFGRTAEWGDLLADGLGAIAGTALGAASRRWLDRAPIKDDGQEN